MPTQLAAELSVTFPASADRPIVASISHSIVYPEYPRTFQPSREIQQCRWKREMQLPLLLGRLRYNCNAGRRAGFKGTWVKGPRGSRGVGSFEVFELLRIIDFLEERGYWMGYRKEEG